MVLCNSQAEPAKKEDNEQFRAVHHQRFEGGQTWKKDGIVLTPMEKSCENCTIEARVFYPVADMLEGSSRKMCMSLKPSKRIESQNGRNRRATVQNATSEGEDVRFEGLDE